MYRFYWKGGTKKDGHSTFKFFLFFLADGDEVIHFDAQKRGIISPDPEEKGLYISRLPIVKIFTNQKGFGLRDAYYNFFFQLEAMGGQTVTIFPLGKPEGYRFEAKGRFLTRDEVKNTFGEDSDTYKFYKRQTYLSRSELMDLVKTSEDTVVSPRGPVRKLRI